jgi:hypothetical protein
MLSRALISLSIAAALALSSLCVATAPADCDRASPTSSP